MNGGDINMNGAHNSLVDTKAQFDTIVHPSFVTYLNKSASIGEITKVFSRTEIREQKKEMEPLRSVHSPRQEIDVDHGIKWSPGLDDIYSSASRGGGLLVLHQGCSNVYRLAITSPAYPFSFYP